MCTKQKKRFVERKLKQKKGGFKGRQRQNNKKVRKNKAWTINGEHFNHSGEIKTKCR